MKIVIDIPEEVYDALNTNSWNSCFVDDELAILEQAFCNGTPLPDNATNGDMIKALFDKRGYTTLQARMEHTMWWNAPYKAGDTDGNS